MLGLDFGLLRPFFLNLQLFRWVKDVPVISSSPWQETCTLSQAVILWNELNMTMFEVGLKILKKSYFLQIFSFHSILKEQGLRTLILNWVMKRNVQFCKSFLHYLALITFNRTDWQWLSRWQKRWVLKILVLTGKPVYQKWCIVLRSWEQSVVFSSQPGRFARCFLLSFLCLC